MAPASIVERLLRRDRAITLVALLILCGLTWGYLLMGAGFGMDARDMTRLALFPHRLAGSDIGTMAGMAGMAGMPPEVPGGGNAGWALRIAMWGAMMIAMMVPSAAPTILLYARVHRHALAQGAREEGQPALAPTGAFAGGYLLIWLVVAVAAALLHGAIEQAGWVSALMMESRSRWLSAGVLIGAGLYQLSPLKAACLTHCRTPASFLARHWRPGVAGALRLGVLHGGFCVGCCWALMVLLFVGGVMNLVWIAALTLVVLAEKLLPFGPWVGRVGGVALIAWGIATLLV